MSNRLAAISKGDVLTSPRFGGLWDVGGRGRAHSMAHPWVLISFTSTHAVYLLPFLSYLAGPKGVSAHPRLSDPDTTTNTALEATVWSIGKNEES